MKTSFSKKIIGLLSFSLLIFPLTTAAQTPSDFLNSGAQNNVITDANFVDINSMSGADIQSFLTANNSYLKDYVDTSPSGANRSAAQIIYDAAHASYDAAAGTAKGITINTSTGTISPKIILVYLQKEQSLVSKSSRDDNALNKAMGYQCPDSGGCDPAYAGFSMQVGWGAWQLRYNYEAAQKGVDWWNANYGAGASSISYVGQTKTIYDYTGSYDITYSNAATASIYRYTPHVFDSAYNVWNFFNYTYFSNSIPTTPSNDNSNTPIDTANDTGQYYARTYTTSITISGSKSAATRVYFNGNLVADLNTASWQIVITPDFGTTNYAVDYQDENGNHVAEKPIQIIRQRAADINNDGKSDLLDLSILANYWGKSNPDEPLADLNSDGTVDILDLSVLAGNWSG